jgi:hypothetical protein
MLAVNEKPNASLRVQTTNITKYPLSLQHLIDQANLILNDIELNKLDINVCMMCHW